jgi:hypothetical protein
MVDDQVTKGAGFDAAVKWHRSMGYPFDKATEVHANNTIRSHRRIDQPN